MPIKVTCLEGTMLVWYHQSQIYFIIHISALKCIYYIKCNSQQKSNSNTAFSFFNRNVYILTVWSQHNNWAFYIMLPDSNVDLWKIPQCTQKGDLNSRKLIAVAYRSFSDPDWSQYQNIWVRSSVESAHFQAVRLSNMKLFQNCLQLA